MYFVTQERCGNLNVLLGKFIQHSVHLTDGEGVIILASHRVCKVDENLKFCISLDHKSAQNIRSVCNSVLKGVTTVIALSPCVNDPQPHTQVLSLASL